MKAIADLQLHSKYSRAVSPEMIIPKIWEWAKRKGIGLIATGDWTHPLWMREIKANLVEIGNGLLRLKPGNEAIERWNDGEKGPFFLLATEVSSIYSQGGKLRRIHNLIWAPSIAVAEKINKELLGRGANLLSDGRPITGITSIQVAELVFSIDPNCLLIPAHAWTPYFSLYGSESGFDSIEECFGNFAKNIYAIETGLSSAPAMNWRIKELDSRAIVSFSDAHCLHPDSFIYLANGGIKRIADLKEEDKLLSLDFVNDLRIKTSTISHIYKFTTPPYLYQIKTHSWEVSVTPNHRFFVLENEKIIEKRASELKMANLIACVRKMKMGNKRAVRLSLPNFRQRVEISRDGLDFLKKKRLKLGCSAKTVSFKVSKSKDFIWMIETGRIRSVKTDIFKKLSKLYNFESEEFVREFKINIFPKIQIPSYTNSELCQVLGYSLGDGGIKHRRKEKRGFTLTDKDINLLLFYKKLISNIFKVEGHLKKSNSQNSYSVFLPYNLLVFFECIAQGIFAPSNKRIIPSIVFKLPKYQLASFLKGFYDAEGTFDDHGLSLCSSSKILLRQIQYLLLKFGLLSAIYSDFEKNKKKYRYKLIIYGQDQLKIFAQKIGFESLPKKKKLLNYISSLVQKAKDSGKDFLPLGQIIKQGMKDLRLGVATLPKNLQNFFYKGFKGLRRRNVKQFIEFFEKSVVEVKTIKFYRILKCLAESDICWEPIKSLIREKANCQFVYDLTIPKYQNYVVNGMITHNSGPKLGREATVFELEELSFENIRKAIINKKQITNNKEQNNQNTNQQSTTHNLQPKIAYTIEFHPEEGKYHYTGHRNCGVKQTPTETKQKGTICPVCGRKLTVGVMHRVEQLAGRTEEELRIRREDLDNTQVKAIYSDTFPNRPPYVMLVPLQEILAEAIGGLATSQKIQDEYKKLTDYFGGEFEVLLEVAISDIAKISGPKVAEAIDKVRRGDIVVDPGYDGVFGVVKIWPDGRKKEEEKQKEQMSLF